MALDSTSAPFNANGFLSAARQAVPDKQFRRLILLFFNDTATTEIYTLSLHDALPISFQADPVTACGPFHPRCTLCDRTRRRQIGRATSELQSHVNLVCRLLLEKKKKNIKTKNKIHKKTKKITIKKKK